MLSPSVACGLSRACCNSVNMASYMPALVYSLSSRMRDDRPIGFKLDELYLDLELHGESDESFPCFCSLRREMSR